MKRDLVQMYFDAINKSKKVNHGLCVGVIDDKKQVPLRSVVECGYFKRPLPFYVKWMTNGRLGHL